MEYFDFDRASFGSHAQSDDVVSDYLELDETDQAANYESLALEGSLDFPQDLSGQLGPQFAGEQPEDAVPNATGEDGAALPAPAWPTIAAKDPCDFCRRMGFDCFVGKRGVMQYSCTCCIALYRECSFAHAKEPGKFLDTLHPVNENVDIPTGGLTGKKALWSLSGPGGFDHGESRARKSNARLSREALRVLKTWLQEHSHHPYPTEQEKDQLKEWTGLKRSQICNWLANARRRGKVIRDVPPRSSSPPIPGAINIPAYSSSAASPSSSSSSTTATKTAPLDISTMTPFERWKHSPPENEPAATSDILRALVNTPIRPAAQQRPSPAGHVRSYSRKTASSNDDSSHANNSNHRLQQHHHQHQHHAPSISVSSSQGTSRSSTSDFSFASAFSHRLSLGSRGSMDRSSKDRRRRRKSQTPVNTFNLHKARSARIFQCTFCADSFPAKYDWQRHEKSLHLALDKWTCSPQGGIVQLHGTQAVCVFCLAPNPDADHLESHNYSACQEKDAQERSFYRKDHLHQHLRLMHNVKFEEASMEAWYSSTTEIRSRCGFCDTQFTTWKARVDHLAAHFKSGADMSQWQGDWGFDPSIQALVENAIPPYLIGNERNSLDPWKTAHVAAAAINPDEESSGDMPSKLKVPEDANCWSRIQRELTAYIRAQVAMGVYPTDQMIQNHGRRVIYDSDDPWNQTCADNPVWLSVLKRDAGLEPVPNAEHIQLSDLGMQPPFALQGGLRVPPAESNPLARVLCRRSLPITTTTTTSSRYSGSGFHSPAIQSSSAAPSMPGSLAGSYVGSFSGMASGSAVAPTAPALSTDWGSNFSAAGQSASFSSAPLHSSTVDPLVQMGFDPEFLQRLNDTYTDLQPDNLDGLDFDPTFPMDDCEPVPPSEMQPAAKSSTVAPIHIPSPRHL
ncbi:hypothetical protein ASPZODRAFT_128645 [Penicilliopsis zonata CBS 506.65]|uniref:Homeobox and C2H2 transcription factor n=1 Tax=Penicilliopsis zonata CBS 506.65 TaxID=1073090 RepID=A0A1L9SS66_9EURO|nr:hypothetical protein ASPZODRAFT_128645 [Penicilliopsis zonata CBS 506.65]OJJ50050.1 hypothetical protein ASPZODRAFT_128645 [Penicilliopsis zonata CBS 506.65]